MQSTSRRGNCYGNALPGTTHVESFWSRFKAELLNGGSFPGLAEAKLEISHHVAYYNAERRHLALGYHSPNHFEAQFKTTPQLCPASLDHLNPPNRNTLRPSLSNDLHQAARSTTITTQTKSGE